jgi:hypothetical protein
MSGYVYVYAVMRWLTSVFEKSNAREPDAEKEKKEEERGGGDGGAQRCLLLICKERAGGVVIVTRCSSVYCAVSTVAYSSSTIADTGWKEWGCR